MCCGYKKQKKQIKVTDNKQVEPVIPNIPIVNPMDTTAFQILMIKLGLIK